jgi:hypothetical protein
LFSTGNKVLAFFSAAESPEFLLETVVVVGVYLFTEEVPELGVAVRGVDGDKLSTDTSDELVAITGDAIIEVVALGSNTVEPFFSFKRVGEIEGTGVRERIIGFFNSIAVLRLFSSPLSLPELNESG